MSSSTSSSSPAGSPVDYSDRRAHERIPARFEVRFQKTEEAARAFRAWSVNLSAGGLALKVNHAYELGERLALTLTVENQCFEVQGVVAWTREDVIGVRFELSDDELRGRLKRLAERFREQQA